MRWSRSFGVLCCVLAFIVLGILYNVNSFEQGVGSPRSLGVSTVTSKEALQDPQIDTALADVGRSRESEIIPLDEAKLPRPALPSVAVHSPTGWAANQGVVDVATEQASCKYIELLS